MSLIEQNLTTCRLQLKDQETLTVVAERTDTPGLVITPRLVRDRLAGDWNLTHLASGLAMPCRGTGSIEHARRLARALGATPVDWTADTETTKAQVEQHREAVDAAIRKAEEIGA